MVCIRECSLRQIPGLIPAVLGVIEENAHELRNGHRRVCVVQLDGDFFRESVPIGIAAPETPHEIA